jgi:hypothetical protein
MLDNLKLNLNSLTGYWPINHSLCPGLINKIQNQLKNFFSGLICAANLKLFMCKGCDLDLISAGNR